MACTTLFKLPSSQLSLPIIKLISNEIKFAIIKLSLPCKVNYGDIVTVMYYLLSLLTKSFGVAIQIKPFVFQCFANKIQDFLKF